MRLITKKKEPGVGHVEVWLSQADFEALVNRRQIRTNCFSVWGSNGGWASVSVAIRLQKDVAPKTKRGGRHEG